MTANEFAAWATERGVPVATTEELLRFAATLEEMKGAADIDGYSPLVYAFDDIVDMTDTNPFGFSAQENGFVIIGGCGNGDPIAIDVANEPGTVWYICHETMHDGAAREASVRVTTTLTEMFQCLGESDFPYDYYTAKDRESHLGH